MQLPGISTSKTRFSGSYWITVSEHPGAPKPVQHEPMASAPQTHDQYLETKKKWATSKRKLKPNKPYTESEPGNKRRQRITKGDPRELGRLKELAKALVCNSDFAQAVGLRLNEGMMVFRTMHPIEEKEGVLLVTNDDYGDTFSLLKNARQADIPGPRGCGSDNPFRQQLNRAYEIARQSAGTILIQSYEKAKGVRPKEQSDNPNFLINKWTWEKESVTLEQDIHHENGAAITQGEPAPLELVVGRY